MSDARPITNVTDFVCSSCWNSFSRNQVGVDRGDHVVCPHCGHSLATARSGDVIAAVNAAPANPLPANGRQPSDGFDMPGQSTLPSFGSPLHDLAPLAPAGHGWLPPDLVSRSAEPAGFIVGEPDDLDDLDFNESTLRPDISHEGLLQAVRTPAATPGLAALLAMEAAASPAPLAVVSDDPSVSVDEPTPPEGTETEPHTPEERDWKLKAIGLTYNFHGLDALIGWASNKAGQPMQISMDGTVWRDFAVFFALHRAGVPAAKAFEDAANPNALAELAATPAVPVRSAVKQPAPELKGTGKDSGSAKAAAARDIAVPRTSGSRPSKAVAAAGSPSKRVPVAAAAGAADRDSKNATRIAAAIAVVVALVIAVLAWKGILPVPGK